MVARRDERITRLALGSDNRAGRLKRGDDAPQLVETIALDLIDPDPDQPRRHFDPEALAELADSLKAVGQLQPIILIRQGPRYRIHVGERRWRAAGLAGLAGIRALVRATAPEAQAALIAQIVENEQRAALSTRELVEAVRMLQAGGLKNGEIAAALSRTASRISELQALADAPPELGARIDALGLGLSYQLLRQWRAHPDATLEFLAHMPPEHISRVTIATIGQSAPLDAGSAVGVDGAPPAPGSTSRSLQRAGEGGSPVLPASAPSKRTSAAPGGPRDLPRDGLATIGSLLVDHPEHGEGLVVFGAAAPADHLAISFAGGAPIALHKDAVRLLRTLPPNGHSA